MTERREPLTSAEHLMLRRRAVVIVPAGLVMGAAVAGMLGWALAELPIAIRAFFGVFFGGVLLFIVGINVGGAFEKEKLTRRGVITGKRVGVSSSVSSSSSSRSSPHYYLSVDGEELSVDLWAYGRVHVGQTVDLMYTARLQTLFDVAIVEDPAATAVEGAEPRLFEPAELPHNEPITAPDRAVLKEHLLRAFVRRVCGGALLALLVWTVIVIAWVIGRAALAQFGDFDRAILMLVAPLAAMLVLFLLNRHTYRLLLDLFGGSRHVATERVVDLVRSNTPLLSPTIVVSGTGMGGDYAWVQTDTRWVQAEGDPVRALASGGPVEIVTAPRSGAVLSVGGVSGPRVRLGVIDLIILVLFAGTLACFSSVAPTSYPGGVENPAAI